LNLFLRVVDYFLFAIFAIFYLCFSSSLFFSLAGSSSSGFLTTGKQQLPSSAFVIQPFLISVAHALVSGLRYAVHVSYDHS
jgi:hypothetical protein